MLKNLYYEIFRNRFVTKLFVHKNNQMSKKIEPTAAELEILKIIWANGPCTVRFINDEINKTKDTGYTTTLKLMQIMFEKGLLQRTSKGKSHIYNSKVKEEDTQNQLLSRFLDSTFRGSAMKLVMQTLGNHKASKDELNQIKEFIDNLEGGNNNETH